MVLLNVPMDIYNLKAQNLGHLIDHANKRTTGPNSTLQCLTSLCMGDAAAGVSSTDWV